MKILITGHNGYIGTHIVSLLDYLGHQTIGCDLNLFIEDSFDEVPSPGIELIKDFRSLTIEELTGCVCVMHLAAISNDPMGDVDKNLTIAVNRDGSIELAKKAKEAGVPRFLFSSSCSIYGKTGDDSLKEDAKLYPLSVYAESKIEAEKGISELASESFTPAFLRNATAYGYSPMLRNDLLVNNLLASVVATNEIRIKSDGTPYRPLIHCKDIANAFISFMNAPAQSIHNKKINVGANSENYQVKKIAGMVKDLIPGSEITYTGEQLDDPRDYKVNFDLLNELLPNFSLNYNVESGMKELHKKLIEKEFSSEDFEEFKYERLPVLSKKLHLLNG